MPTPIRFKGIVGTTAEIATDRFAGRIAFDSTLARFVVFFDATNYAINARRDVLETFAAGIQDSTLTAGLPMYASTSGRHATETAVAFRARISAYGSGDNAAFGTLSTTGLATLAQATVSDLTTDRIVTTTTGGRLQTDAGLTRSQASGITRAVLLGNGSVANDVFFRVRRTATYNASFRMTDEAGTSRWELIYLPDNRLGIQASTSGGVAIDYILEAGNGSGNTITIGGSTNRTTNFTGAIQTSGVTRISSGGAGALTTLSTTGLATLAQATVSDLTTGRMVSTTTGGRLQTLTNSASLALIGAADNEAIEDANMMTGFSDPAGVVQSYNSATRVVTITHASGTVEYWFKGRKYTQSSPWTLPAHTATVGNWFYSSADGTTFSWSTTPWEFESVLVSYVRYGTYLKFSLRECHGMMDPMVHRSGHNNIGTYLGSGGTLTAATYTVQPATPADADNTPGIDLTTLYDEDLLTSLPALPQGTYAVCWPVGSELNVQSLSVPFRVTAAGYINWFNAGVETQAANNRFLNVYAVAMPVTSDATSQSYRWIWIAPQASYSSAVDAAAETFSEINAGDISAGITEYLPRFKITYATGAAYTSTGKCRIHAVETLDRSKVNATTPTTPVALTLDGLTDVDTTGQATGDFLSLESDGIWRTQTAAEVRALIGSTFANLFTGRRTVTGLTNGVTGTLIPTYTFAANTWATGGEAVVRFSLLSTRDGQVEMKLGGNTVSSINLPSTVRCVIELILTCQSAGASARFAYATRISYPGTSGTPIDEAIFGDSQASADGIGDGWTVDSTASMNLTFDYTPSTGSGNPVLHAGTIRISTP